MDTFNRKLEKTTVSGDQTHIFIMSWNYELPFGRSKRFLAGINAVADKFVRGWQINGIQTYRSGTLIGVSGGGALPLFGGGNRPNWISGDVRSSASSGSFDPARDRYLNISAFSQPVPYTFGNAPPRLPNVRTPFYYNEDISLFKNTYITESVYVQFRSEFYNIFNRVVFGGPSASINNPSTFGVIGSQANTPRLIQFALKLIF